MRTLGVTPQQYTGARKLARFRAEVRRSGNVADAVYGAGFGSPSRVYESAHERLGMTPGTLARGGEGEVIRYATAPCSLGFLLVAVTPRGVCSVRLGDSADALARELRQEFPSATLAEHAGMVRDSLRRLLDALDATHTSAGLADVPLDIRATAFQQRVWEELRRIPRGETRTYTEVARAIGAPSAVRAVARACATNPVALAIPCHRVVRGDGSLAGYRWGVERKRALLENEKRSSRQQGD